MNSSEINQHPTHNFSDKCDLRYLHQNAGLDAGPSAGLSTGLSVETDAGQDSVGLPLERRAERRVGRRAERTAGRRVERRG